uniref:BAHD acyltransferase n=1 Tax=Fagus sylvatica TaxID=28930 RepID=A0A2N9FTG6_FAGSY
MNKIEMEIKVEIIKRETIKPSSLTPHNLRCFDLCLIDQLQPIVYIPLALFYSNHNDPLHNSHAKVADKSHKLKTSLSESLTRFYPLAGRIKDHVSIECNDVGADYLEARVNCLLSDILQQPEQKMLHFFLPEEIESLQAGTERLVLVQASFFECGGMAIGVCISHRLADAAMISMFIKGWADMALGSGEEVVPEFSAASRLPPRRDFSPTPPAMNLMNEKRATKRYVFDASKIASLKAKAASASVEQTTRIEAVSALIWKCAMTASRSNFGSPKPSMLIQMMNIRKRVLPPFSENSFGNLVWYFGAQTRDSQTELHSLVGELRKGKEAFTENYATKFQGDEAFSIVGKCSEEFDNHHTTEVMDSFCFSSWCRYPLYEADFGWGKPTWVTIAGLVYKNVTVLMDTRDGSGIEAWVTLSEEDMTLFQRDQELLTFASLNPSVLDKA